MTDYEALYTRLEKLLEKYLGLAREAQGRADSAYDDEVSQQYLTEGNTYAQCAVLLGRVLDEHA